MASLSRLASASTTTSELRGGTAAALSPYGDKPASTEEGTIRGVGADLIAHPLPFASMTSGSTSSGFDLDACCAGRREV